MRETLDQTRAAGRAPTVPPVRSRAIEFTLVILGVLVAAAGAYLLFAPEDWWLGDAAEAWHLSAFIVGGVLMMTGLGVYANESFIEDGRWSARVVTGAMVALLALAGAVVAALFLIL